MSFFDVVFYLFAAITVMAGMGVVLARNPVHAALFLVLAFCSSAGIWMLLEAEFLAIALVLVYVGAVMVLFLFQFVWFGSSMRREPKKIGCCGKGLAEISLSCASRLTRYLPPLDSFLLAAALWLVIRATHAHPFIDLGQLEFPQPSNLVRG